MPDDVASASVALAVLDDLPGLVRRCIRSRGVTQRQAAREMGLAEPALCNLLAGRTTNSRGGDPRDGPTHRIITQMLTWCVDDGGQT